MTTQQIIEPPLNDALRNALRSTVKSWAFAPTSVTVMNDILARQYGLILTESQENPG